MSHAYEGPTPVRAEDKVELLSTEGVYNTAIVVSALSKQFVCVTEDNTLFFFYSDQGITWRKQA